MGGQAERSGDEKGDRTQETRESRDGKSDVKRTESQDRDGKIAKEEIKEHVGEGTNRETRDNKRGLNKERQATAME